MGARVLYANGCLSRCPLRPRQAIRTGRTLALAQLTWFYLHITRIGDGEPRRLVGSLQTCRSPVHFSSRHGGSGLRSSVVVVVASVVMPQQSCHRAVVDVKVVAVLWHSRPHTSKAVSGLPETGRCVKSDSRRHRDQLCTGPTARALSSTLSGML